MEMDDPCRNLDKGNSSSKKKRKAVCRFWLFKYILWSQWFAFELALLQVSEGYEPKTPMVRYPVTSQTCHFANCQFANVLGRFANASQSIRKRNMNQRKSTEENHVTFNHYKWWIDCVTRLIDEQCRKIHTQYHFIKPLNDLLNYSLVFTNIYKCDGFCVIDDNRVSWNARSEDRVLNTYPR